jgi:very-short-patch-repair endonuclease
MIESDKIKAKIARRNGYQLITVWQRDWEENRESTLTDIIKQLKYERKI